VRLRELLAEATRTLAAARLPSPRVDAELLAAYVLEIDRGKLFLVTDVTAEHERRFRDLIGERAERIPLQHLTGTAPFRHLQLRVGEGVFIPRPETELLVDWGLNAIAGVARPIVVDLCSGSGALAAAVAAESPQAVVIAVERERPALEWLRRNVIELGVSVVGGDVTDPSVIAELNGVVDLVLCNPPYVPEIGAAGLPAEVLEHDPHEAVFAGTDGLAVIRPVIGRIAALLKPGGACAIEHDDTHAYVVPNLINDDGRYRGIQLHHDLAGRPRFTTATRADR
jgi:release factor glutamine methyltransferase